MMIKPEFLHTCCILEIHRENGRREKKQLNEIVHVFPLLTYICRQQVQPHLIPTCITCPKVAAPTFLLDAKRKLTYMIIQLKNPSCKQQLLKQQKGHILFHFVLHDQHYSSNTNDDSIPQLISSQLLVTNHQQIPSI